ncbi:MAG TPA: MarR family transcriptional regulator [Acidimicrobiales bacterium]|nr:MarR family transcriptional regulator [Acidimicrobiales bacterium]
MAIVSVDVAKVAGDLELLLSRLRRRLRLEAPNIGLTLSQMAVLSRLEHEGPETASGLAAAERVRPQSMAATLSSLEAEGMIERKDDLNDRRQIFISSTAKGNEIVASARRSRGEWLTRALSNYFDQEEQEVLVNAVRLLDRLVDCEEGSFPTREALRRGPK